MYCVALKKKNHRKKNAHKVHKETVAKRRTGTRFHKDFAAEGRRKSNSPHKARPFQKNHVVHKGAAQGCKLEELGKGKSGQKSTKTRAPHKVSHKDSKTLCA